MPSIGGWGGGLVRLGTGTAWGAGELIPSGCRCRCCRGFVVVAVAAVVVVAVCCWRYVTPVRLLRHVPVPLEGRVLFVVVAVVVVAVVVLPCTCQPRTNGNRQ